MFKFGPYGGDDKKPLLTLGTKFEPGNDDRFIFLPGILILINIDIKYLIGFYSFNIF